MVHMVPRARPEACKSLAVLGEGAVFLLEWLMKLPSATLDVLLGAVNWIFFGDSTLGSSTLRSIR
jgi:hypothetical protein